MIVWGEEMKNRKIKKNRRGEIYMNKLLITVRKKRILLPLMQQLRGY